MPWHWLFRTFAGPVCVISLAEPETETFGSKQNLVLYSYRDLPEEVAAMPAQQSRNQQVPFVINANMPY